MKARINITLRTGVLDTQGAAINQALGALGYTGVSNVRQGKVIEMELAETSPEAARESVEAMCRALLVNAVIEDYSIELS